MNKHFRFARVPLAAALAVAAAGARASVDVSPISAAATDVATIGAAVFLVYVGIKVFKWVRGAL